MKELLWIILIGEFLIIQNSMCQNNPCDTMELKDHIDTVCLCPTLIKPIDKTIPDRPILVIEEPAIFPNGDLIYFVNLIQDCVTESFIDSSGINSKVIIRFVIDTDGSLVDFNVLRCNNSNLARATLECLKKSPKWIPAKQRGKNVRQLVDIPIINKRK